MISTILLFHNMSLITIFGVIVLNDKLAIMLHYSQMQCFSRKSPAFKQSHREIFLS